MCKTLDLIPRSIQRKHNTNEKLFQYFFYYFSFGIHNGRAEGNLCDYKLTCRVITPALLVCYWNDQESKWNFLTVFSLLTQVLFYGC
jgi:hypothetical protein